MCLSDVGPHNKQNATLYVQHVSEFYLKLSLVSAQWWIVQYETCIYLEWKNICCVLTEDLLYEVHLESKEHFAIKKYLLIIGKKKNMQVLSHTFTYFST